MPGSILSRFHPPPRGPEAYRLTACPPSALRRRSPEGATGPRPILFRIRLASQRSARDEVDDALLRVGQRYRRHLRPCCHVDRADTRCVHPRHHRTAKQCVELRAKIAQFLTFFFFLFFNLAEIWAHVSAVSRDGGVAHRVYRRSVVVQLLPRRCDGGGLGNDLVQRGCA